LQYASDLINEVIRDIRGIKVGIHVCRGNWSRKEEVLLSGNYSPLLPAFQKMRVNQYVLEYATPRAGEIDIVGQALGDKEIGLGVCNPRTEEVEDPANIISSVQKALHYFRPESIYLNPDCGFGCFALRCVNDADTAFRKLQSMVAAARILRESHS